MVGRLSFIVFLVSGICALLCIPAVLIAERNNLSDGPFHVVAMVSTPICLVSGLWFLVRSRKQKKGLPQALAGAGVILAAGWLCFVAFVFAQLFLAPIVEDHRNRIPFDSKVWKHPQLAPSVDYPRLRMVDDLLDRHENLKGMTKQEIDDLLGPASDLWFPTAAIEYIYHLGPQRYGFLRIDSEWLCISFSDGKVDEVRIITD
ncbi:MAG: hypothetical protein ACYTEQ_28410 [Planctomycetota bacterium]|jgi:hypothetical protein